MPLYFSVMFSTEEIPMPRRPDVKRVFQKVIDNLDHPLYGHCLLCHDKAAFRVSCGKLRLKSRARFYGFRGEAQYLHGHTGVLTIEVEGGVNAGVNMVFPCNEIQKTAWDVLKETHGSFLSPLPNCGYNPYPHQTPDCISNTAHDNGCGSNGRNDLYKCRIYLHTLRVQIVLFY